MQSHCWCIYDNMIAFSEKDQQNHKLIIKFMNTPSRMWNTKYINNIKYKVHILFNYSGIRLMPLPRLKAINNHV